jgi:hypothetical protein
MGYELVAGVTELIGVAVAGEVESALQRCPIDRQAGRDHGVAGPFGDGAVAVLTRRRVELLDDREEIGEKLAVR